ncbi:putative bifunctional diguanylate cyclase/phosphodiesterase [Methylobacterium haplocladii]|uniref:Bifunctional diguanylate cyclase/phosphodiesterase n=1 Tax=Methylobacterium haplocladii TaxID=1176176 RepID=A0A512ISP9_9HYPH|nr:EAL domain-containing protein [Methylobacterium haplocladii]GEP00713.1 bifunctional diguanylate cyclase/phosphodiesterase [Methylobacterium haplocladii]GJD82406.1 hypothetical protein HPGCJGGD_0260 [Methylobacterium haplocladii]GLS60514.1 bifunctional diguanylate cyclase/phosphodiesterase [Methylobacterium haplocladii]
MPPSTGETRRLAALVRTGLLAAAADETFLSLVSAASGAFGMPIATISLVGRDDQTYFAKVGIGAEATERSISFCSQTIACDAPLVVLDAGRDPRWRDNPLVRGEPHIRFYAGVPLYIEGQAIGTFCVIDTVPHAGFTELQRQMLQRYATIAGEMLELRSLKAGADRERARFKRLSEACPDGMTIADGDGHVLHWNGAAERLLGYTAEEARHLRITDLLPEGDRAAAGFRAWIDVVLGEVREIDLVNRSGVVRHMEISVSRWREDEETFHGMVLRDTSGRREKEQALHRLAHCDGLTGLPNRAAMRAQLGAAMRGGAVGVLLVDLDGFKDVNDTIGHAAGDEVLREAAARLVESIRATDIVTRIGGDEFVVILPGCGDASKAGDVADRIVAAMEEPLLINDRTVRIGASVGIALAPAQAETIDDLLLCADLAVYKAKAEGRHRQRLYTPSLRAVVSERQRFVHEFHRAIERDEFVLHYQPQVRLKDGALVGAEALIRWQHPEHGLLQPGAFLPALLSSRHAVTVNDWVLRTACTQAAAWLPFTDRQFRMGVNACAVRLHSGEISAFTMDTLAATGLPAENLELEITETVVLAHEGACTAALRELRAQGIGIAFDDFGTGYASLSMLEDFPLNRLKIDRSFVRKMNDAPDVPVIRAILQLAKSFGLDVIAEGIETEDQLRRLRKKGCAEGQGYLFSRPIPADEFQSTFIHAAPTAAIGLRRVA